MLNRLTPQSLVVLGALVCLSVAALSLTLALSAPWSGATFAVEDDQLVLRALARNSPNHPLPSGVVTAFVIDGQPLAPRPEWLIEEPDVLPDYTSYNRLMAEQSLLTDAARHGQLAIQINAAAPENFVVQTRAWNQLPFMFWLQLFFGVGGAMTGILVWSTRRHDRAASLYALTGLGYLIFAPAAAVYSTRELLLDGDIFRGLALTNHFGALLFTASLTGLLCSYPKRLCSSFFIATVFSFALVIWLVDATQVLNPMGFHLGVLLIFFSSFFFAAWQWRATGSDPVARAALRWFLLAIYLATGLFASVIIIPAALQLPQPASQGVMFGAFLIMYWGLALGIVRYRLFELSQWWHAIMTWFLGGVAVLVLDTVLILALALPADIALSLAVAVTGWLYFPLRQFFWNRFGKLRHGDINAWLPDILPLLLARDADLTRRWPEALQRVWQAASVEPAAGSRAYADIVDDGMTLRVPDIQPDSQQHFRVAGANGGLRLFTRTDRQSSKNLARIMHLALAVLDAESKGADLERERIRRDIHDDIGARLLTLLHSSGPEHQPLVRDTLSATRDLVKTLSASATSSQQALASWRNEAEERCTLAGINLRWQAEENSLPAQLSARQYTNLTRILRESLSNALHHGTGDAVSVRFLGDPQSLHIEIANDSANVSDSPVINSCGSGQRILDERAQEIGGHLTRRTERNQFILTLRCPIVPDADPFSESP